MEMSKSAKEILVQAQMFKKDTGSSKLCVEHLLYGVLLMADYKEPPFDKSVYTGVGERVRAMVEQKFASVASAREQLTKRGKSDSSRFVDAGATLGRATELARGGEIDELYLTQAVLERSTPVIESLKKVKFDRLADKDARYHPEGNKPPVTPPVNPPEEEKKDDSLSTTQAAILLALLGEALKSQNIKPSGKRRNGKRRTKMGLFTFRGGKVAAIIQYFLFGILIPAIPIAVLYLKTGFLSQPHAPWLSFLGMVYVCLWAFYLGRGLSLVIGLGSCAFGNFLDIKLDFALIGALAYAVSLAWGMPEIPRWARIVSCVLAMLVQLFGNALYDSLRDKDDVTKTRILLSDEKGTPDKIFFHTFSKMLTLPLLAFSIWWIWQFDIPVWVVKALWIVGFVLVFYVIWVGFICHRLRYENSRRRSRAGARFAKFLVNFHLVMFIPYLVLMLHWVFGWFPMKLWVEIVLGVYSLIMLIASIGVAKNSD